MLMVLEKNNKAILPIKYIQKYEDIFNLKNKKEIINLNGWGELSFNKLGTSIENSKNISLKDLYIH